MGHIEKQELQKEMEMKLPLLFVYMFYVCIILGLIQLIGFALALFICLPPNHFIAHEWAFIINLLSFIMYGVLLFHLFLCWLSRLYFTFHASAYAKSTAFYITIMIITLSFLLLLVAGLTFRYFISFEIGLVMITLSGLSYIIVSAYLMVVFMRHLLDLATVKIVTLKVETSVSLKREVNNIEQLGHHDAKYIQLVSKYFVLGVSSFIPTLLVLAAGSAQFASDTHTTIGIVKSLVIIDVIVNTICIYMQYKFAMKRYYKLFGCLDKLVHDYIHKKAVQKIRRDTFTFYNTQFKSSVDPSTMESIRSEIKLRDKASMTVQTVPTTQLATIPSDGPLEKEEKTTTTNPTSQIKNRMMVELPLKEHDSNSSMDFDKLINYKKINNGNGNKEKHQNGSINGQNEDNEVQNNATRTNTLRTNLSIVVSGHQVPQFDDDNVDIRLDSVDLGLEDELDRKKSTSHERPKMENEITPFNPMEQQMSTEEERSKLSNVGSMKVMGDHMQSLTVETVDRDHNRYNSTKL